MRKLRSGKAKVRISMLISIYLFVRQTLFTSSKSETKHWDRGFILVCGGEVTTWGDGVGLD